MGATIFNNVDLAFGFLGIAFFFFGRMLRLKEDLFDAGLGLQIFAIILIGLAFLFRTPL